eukprot:scaffold1901_cov236-Pinguiococcus_pyrenoidosus.AAC.4
MGAAASAMKRQERDRKRELPPTAELDWAADPSEDEEEAEAALNRSSEEKDASPWLTDSGDEPQMDAEDVNFPLPNRGASTTPPAEPETDDDMCLLPEDEKALRRLIAAAEIPMADADDVVDGIVAMLHRRQSPTRDDFLAQGLPERLVDAIQETFGMDEDDEDDEDDEAVEDDVGDGDETDAAIEPVLPIRTSPEPLRNASSGESVASRVREKRVPRTISNAETEPAGASPTRELRHMNSQDSFFEEESLPAADSGLALYRAAMLSSSRGSEDVEQMSRDNAEEGSLDGILARLVQPGQWKLGDMIGSGSFGDVFVGMNEVNGHLIAIKVVTLQGREAEIMALDSEIGLMKSLHHPNIVCYLGSELQAEKGRFFIFQEWVPGGSVDSLLKKFGGRFSVAVCLRYTKQILRGLAYLHENQIMHRDIKGGNILVDDRGVVKLADFGCSKRIAPDGTQSFGASTLTGTPFFMAPEVMMADQYGRRADVWSVGGVVLQMCTGAPPWKSIKPRSAWALFTHIKQTTGPPPMPDDLPSALHAFLVRCFERDPQQRPHAVELLQDPWIRGEGGAADRQIGIQRSNSNLDVLDRVNSRSDNYRRARSAVNDAATPRGSSRTGNIPRDLSRTNTEMDGGGESGMLDQLRAAIGSNLRKSKSSNDDLSDRRRHSARPKRNSSTSVNDSPMDSPRRRPRRYTGNRRGDGDSSVVDSDAPTPRAGHVKRDARRLSSMGDEDHMEPGLHIRGPLSNRQFSLDDESELGSVSPTQQPRPTNATQASSGTCVTLVTQGTSATGGSANTRENHLRKDPSLNPYSHRSRSPASNRHSPMQSPANARVNPFGSRKRAFGDSPRSPARSGLEAEKSYFVADVDRATTLKDKASSPRPESVATSPAANPFANRSRGHTQRHIVHSIKSTTGRVHSADSEGAPRRRTSGATPFRSEDLSELLRYRTNVENGHVDESSRRDAERSNPFASKSVSRSQRRRMVKDMNIQITPLDAALKVPKHRGGEFSSPDGADEVLLGSVAPLMSARTADSDPRGRWSTTPSTDASPHMSPPEAAQSERRFVKSDDRSLPGPWRFDAAAHGDGVDEGDFEVHDNLSGDE